MLKLHIKTFLIVLISSHIAYSKNTSLTQFAKEHNKAIQSHEAYLKWLSKHETPDNVDFLKNYMKQNSVELRPMEVMNDEISFVGKKNYTRVKILDAKKGLIQLYGKSVRVPLYKPYKSILKINSSTKASYLETLIQIIFPNAVASDDYSWSGESWDIFTGVRMWFRTNLSSTSYDNGLHGHYCLSPENPILTSISEKDFDSQDKEDNCYKVFLALAEVTTHYNTAMENYEDNVKLETKLLHADNRDAAHSSRLSHASQNTNIPKCILEDIISWKRQFCAKLRQDPLKGCQITTSNPPTLFDCKRSYTGGDTLPQKIKVGVGWSSSDFNTNHRPGSR